MCIDVEARSAGAHVGSKIEIPCRQTVGDRERPELGDDRGLRMETDECRHKC